jgi:hypothetical protein
MTGVPDKAIYRCPEHGLFMVETNGIVWKERSCTHKIHGLTGMEFPCGMLSPLASVDDPDLTDKDKNIGTLTPDAMESLRASIASLRAEREQMRQNFGDKPNYMFGGSENRRNGRVWKGDQCNEIPIQYAEQARFEAAERERMRAAMNEVWD